MTDSCSYDQMSAKELAAAFRVSERTARRHRAKGTLPSTERVACERAGKVFLVPASKPPHIRTLHRSRLSRDLYMARDAIRRLARAEAFTDEDLRVAKIIYDEVADLTGSWGRSAGEA